MFIVMIVFMLAAVGVARSWRGVAVGAAIWAVLTTALHLWLTAQEGRAAPGAAVLMLFVGFQLVMAGGIGALAYAIRQEVERGRPGRQSPRSPIA